MFTYNHAFKTEKPTLSTGSLKLILESDMDSLEYVLDD